MLQIIHCKKRGARFGQDRLPRYIGGDKAKQFLEGLRRARGSAERRWTTWKQCGQRVIPYYFTPTELKKFLAACREEWNRRMPTLRSDIWRKMPEWRGVVDEMREAQRLYERCYDAAESVQEDLDKMKKEKMDNRNPRFKRANQILDTMKSAIRGLNVMGSLDYGLWAGSWKRAGESRRELNELLPEVEEVLGEYEGWRTRRT